MITHVMVQMLAAEWPKNAYNRTQDSQQKAHRNAIQIQTDNTPNLQSLQATAHPGL